MLAGTLIAVAVSAGVVDRGWPHTGFDADSPPPVSAAVSAPDQLAAPAPNARVGGPGAAQAAASSPGGTDPALAALRAEVLARIRYPWQQRVSGWEIDFVGPRPGFLGTTLANERRIEIYVSPERNVEDLAFTVAHEIGHAVDLTLLEGDERDRWLAERGATGTTWWADNAESDYGVGAGDWAEAFAVWQLGGRSFSTLAGPPTEAQLRLVARLASGG